MTGPRASEPGAQQDAQLEGGAAVLAGSDAGSDPRHVLRAAVCVATLALTTYAAGELARILSPNGQSTPELLAVALFVPCFAWAAFGALVAAVGLVGAGAWKRSIPRAAPDEEVLASGDRTAIVIPIHNEDPAQVTARLEVMFRALRTRTLGPLFDFFLLSDTTDSSVWLAEEAAWRAVCERLGAFGRVFYRRRARPEAKKSGNVRDFCLRHGRAYRYLVVLDADSVVTAETLCALMARMHANPRIGILQAPPLPVRRSTLFARWQQFAARTYGPVWAVGEALLAGPDGNYYGHNAILRSEAFCAHGGLGRLPGTRPLSGLVASHDFVEAALLRRAGYEVWLAPDLDGSYEQCPTNLIDYAVRDRRWCHGNLQHLRIATLPGLVGWSRMHLLRGALSYLIPPLWLAFAAALLVVSAHDLAFEPAYFPATGRALFPRWPVYDFEAARRLFLIVVAMLFAPRLIAAVVAFARLVKERATSLLGAPAFVASLLAEWILGTLLAPAMMVFQAYFVVTSILGEPVRWSGQRRDDRQVSLGEALRCHAVHVLTAVALGVGAALVSTQTLLWTTPVVVPLLFSPLLTVLTSSPVVSRLADRLGLLKIPEDRSTSEMLTVFDAPAAEAGPSAHAILADRRACAWHALTVVGSGLAQRLPDSRRAELRDRLRSAEALDHAETHACLTDVDVLLDAMHPREDASIRAV